MKNKMQIRFTLNNQAVETTVEGGKRLVDFLREDMGLTGTKVGCGEGDCGACTVLVDGLTANSCMMLAAQIDGRSVLTIEGLGDYDKLHPLQEAFIAEGAVQCGFCTPGMLLSAKALLDQQPRPNRAEILKAISGNLCRCTGYQKIANAIERVAGTKGGAER